MLDSILSFLETNPDWVNWTLFLLVFIECLFIAGLFTPATLIIPAVGVLAASIGISPYEITFYATMGMIVGDSVSYFLGRSIGNKLFDRVPLKYHGYVKQAQTFMQKWGILSVALGRFFLITISPLILLRAYFEFFASVKPRADKCISFFLNLAQISEINFGNL